uniref:cullin-RING-type E3 NEDD8 transferase n=1 Tax=Athene cunicularia TaxID=194338 RepID=A0A663N3Q8_ATHCN
APVIVVHFLLCVVCAHVYGSSRWGKGETFFHSMCVVQWNPENQIESCSCLLLDACLRCQAENKQEDCVVVWGECNHSFHNCCMSLWVKQNNRCPLCQQDWVVQRIGK